MVSFKNKHSNLPEDHEKCCHAMSQALEGQFTESNPNSTNHLELNLSKLRTTLDHFQHQGEYTIFLKGRSEDQDNMFQALHNEGSKRQPMLVFLFSQLRTELDSTIPGFYSYMCRFSDLQENIMSRYGVFVLSLSVSQMSFNEACFSSSESGMHKNMINTDVLFLSN